MTQALFTLLGVGTSSGVPRLGCLCPICTTTDIEPKNRRQRVAGLLEIGDKKLLVDAGPDIRNQLLEQKVCHIDALFLTHNHFDHIAGIDDVKWITGYPKQSLPIFANRPTYLDLKKRIAYLFEHDLYDLPNSQRPFCHRAKDHSYVSVYGRMRWNLATQTITTGFGSTGQGRFVHPLRRRTLTPHEACRVQFIPDFFSFPETRRRHLQEMIGNAVPPKLAYVIALSLLAR